MIQGVAHAPEVRQLGLGRAWLLEHFAQQAGVSRIVLDKESFSCFVAHQPIRLAV